MRQLKVGDKILITYSPDLGSNQQNKLYTVVESTSSSRNSDAYVSVRCIDDGTGNPLGNGSSSGSKWSFRPAAADYVFVGDKEKIIEILEERMNTLERQKEETALLLEIATEGIEEGLSKEEYIYNYLEVQKEKGKSKEDLVKIMKMVNNEVLFKALSSSCKA